MLFSIITPSLGQIDWLRLCVASVRDQVSSSEGIEIEHLIMDGGTEGIWEWLTKIGDRRSEIGGRSWEGAKVERWEGGKVEVGDRRAEGGVSVSDSQSFRISESSEPGYRLRVCSEADKGMYDALRKGFQSATGEIVGHLNSDEQYLPGTLQAVASWFNDHPEREMLIGDAIMVGSDGGYLSSRSVSIPNPLHMRLTGNLTVFTASTFFRRRMFERGVDLDTRWKVVGDAEWILRLVEAGVPMGVRRGYLSTFTWNPHILSNTALGDAERARLYREIPAPLRLLKYPLIAMHRVGRLIQGAYNLRPHAYEIYTKSDPSRRSRFDVLRPTHRWPKRSEGGEHAR